MYDYKDAETYYIAYGGRPCAWRGAHNLHRKRPSRSLFLVPKLRNSDIITMQMDCTGYKDWVLTYFHNDKEVGHLNIQPNLTYYICMSTDKTNQEYQIIY